MIHQPIQLTKERKICSKTTDSKKLKTEVRYKQRNLKEFFQSERDSNY